SPRNSPATATAGAREFTESAVPVPQRPSPPIAPPKPVQPTQVETQNRARPAPSEHSAAENVSKPPGRILVRTTPAGARVRLDGRDVGATPLTIRDLSHGVHQIHVAHDGYAPADRRVTITSSAPAQSITVELARLRASVPEPATPATLGRFVGAL